MSKKTLTIIIIIIAIIVALGAGAFLYLTFGGDKTEDKTGEGEISPPVGFFPTDISSDGGDVGSGITIGEARDSGDVIRLGEGEEKLAHLRKIADGPIAGAVLFEKDGVNIVRYIERKTGHVYELEADSLRARRITNTTIPRVRESVWSRDGKSVAIFYQDEETGKIITFLAAINEEKNELSGEFLQDDIIALSPSEETDRLLLVADSGGEAIGFSTRFDGRDRIRLFDSLFGEWIASWPKAASVALATKPSAGTKGYLYFVNTKSGSFEKKLGDINGLTALVSAGASHILYSKSAGRGVETYLDGKILPIKTLSDKCAWGGFSDAVYCGVPQIIFGGDYPDLWYQGKVSFNDDIWKIDAESGFVDLVVSPSDSIFEDIDVVEPHLSSDGAYLVFKNKKDQSLWLLEVRE